jgi:hypothetical protein
MDITKDRTIDNLINLKAEKNLLIKIVLRTK